MSEDGMKVVRPEEKHRVFRDEVLAVVQKHAAKMDPTEILAILAYTVGQAVAMQDQRKTSGPEAMKLVAANIEQGNRDAIEAVMKVFGPKQ